MLVYCAITWGFTSTRPDGIDGRYSDEKKPLKYWIKSSYSTSHCCKYNTRLLNTVQKPVVTTLTAELFTKVMRSSLPALETSGVENWASLVPLPNPPPTCPLHHHLHHQLCLVVVRPLSPECLLDGSPLHPRDGVNAQSGQRCNPEP